MLLGSRDLQSKGISEFPMNFRRGTFAAAWESLLAICP